MAKLTLETRAIIRDYEKKVSVLKTKLIAHIDTLPDNPKIKRVGDGKSFTMNVSDLGDNWSPFYHDFKAQYQDLIRIINTKPVEQVISSFESVIKNGYTGKRAGDSSKRFHPVVREYLKEMM